MNELKYCQKIINKLIHSNMAFDDDSNLYINFGVYRITYKGGPKSSLADARKYFKQQIALITKDW